ncbi:MAG: glucose-6-phosphate isomerase, partial [Actinomycetes bacterium]
MSGSSLAVSLGGAAQQAAERVVPGFVEQRVASRLAEGDANLWGEEAQSEASIRLAWTMLPKTSQSLVPRIIELRDRLRSEGVDHVVLCGMGGSSLAPEVITRTAGVELTVLDSTDPDYVRAALADRLERSVVVVSSKSGSTLETDSQRRAYEQAFRDAGIDPRGRIVAVTDPGSGLESSATEAGYEVFTADPHVGGRYSALTAFGLVPSGLAGADIGRLLDEAEAAIAAVGADSPDNPALQLGAALGATEPLRDKIVLVDTGSGVVGLGDWTEQLLAESTGKHGRGVLPVVVSGPDSPEVVSPPNDVLVVRLVGDAADASGLGEAEVAVSGPLGALLL